MCVCVFLFLFIYTVLVVVLGRKLLLPIHIATVILLLLWLMHYALPVCLHARERDEITEASGWEEVVESHTEEGG